MTTSRTTKRRSIMLATTGLLTVAAVGWASISSVSTSHYGLMLTDQEVEFTLARCDLSPAMLAAAGVTPNQVAGLVSRGRNELGPVIQDLRDADTRFQTQIAIVHAKQRLVDSGIATQEDRSQLAAAREAVAAASGARAEVIDAVQEAAEDGLEPAQVTALANLRTNRGTEVPLQYRVVTRTQAQWVALRDALSAKRIAEKRGMEVPGFASTIVTEANGDPAVAASLVNMNSNNDQILSSWFEALDTE